MNLFRKYYSIPFRERVLFIKAIGVSLAVKMVVVALPMKWYSRYLYSRRTVSNADEETIKRVTRAVSRCSRYAPWSTKCLVDAITAKLLLQWAGINSTLYLGVHKDKAKKLVAHAWLKCGERFITGRKGFQKFTVVSSFA